MQPVHTLEAIAAETHPLVRTILDRQQPITQTLVDTAVRQPQLSWHGRKPIPAVDRRGQPRPTNLDLLSVLMELYRRQATVSIASYEGRTPWQIVAGQQHVGSKRFGAVTSLVSHHAHLSFSLQMHDESIVHHTDGSHGATRHYMLADYDGSWHAGFGQLSWEYSAAERAYYTRRQLLQPDGSLRFADYMHVNRKQSIFSSQYMVLKLLQQRIAEDLQHYQDVCAQLTVTNDTTTATANTVILRGDTQSTAAPTFEVDFIGPTLRGGRPVLANSLASYHMVRAHIAKLRQWRSLAQFMTRTAEVAFYRFGHDNGYTAPWIRDTAWYATSEPGQMKIDLGEHLSLVTTTGLTEKRVAA